MHVPQALRRKLDNLARLNWRARAWLVPAWCALGCSRLLLLMLPFHRLAARLGTACGTAPFVPLINAHQARLSSDLGQAVRTAARYTPWRSDCLPQALTAHALLTLHGIPSLLCLGIHKLGPQATVEAHAWLVAGPHAITGGNGFQRFQVIGSYVCLLP